MYFYLNLCLLPNNLRVCQDLGASFKYMELFKYIGIGDFLEPQDS